MMLGENHYRSRTCPHLMGLFLKETQDKAIVSTFWLCLLSNTSANTERGCICMHKHCHSVCIWGIGETQEDLEQIPDLQVCS